MKFTEKLQFIKSGATWAEIKQLEEQEAAEIEASKKKQGPDPAAEPPKEGTEPPKEGTEPSKEPEPNNELLTALEAATKALEESKATITKQKDELAKLNEDFAKLNNKQTVAETHVDTAADVMKQLFKPETKKEV